MFERAAGIARGALYLDAGIYIEGNRELTIENCRRIEEYNEVFMRLISGGLCIQIWGTDLKAYDFRTRGLIVRGKISQIDLIERSAAKHEGSATGLREDKR